MFIEDLKRSSDIPNINKMTLNVEYTKDFGKHNMNYVWAVTYTINRRFSREYILSFAKREEILSSYVLDQQVKNQGLYSYLAHVCYELMNYEQPFEIEENLVNVR